MKKITAVILALVLALCLGACGEQVKTETIYVQTQSVRTIYDQEIRMEYTYSDKGTPLSVKTYFNDKLYQTASTRTSNGVSYLTVVDAAGNESVQTTETFYDDNGNVSRIEISVGGNVVSRTTYTYDENGNTLTASNVTTLGTVSTSYTYDENGNVISKEEDDGSTGEFTRMEYTYNEQNYVTEEKTFDEDGVLQGSIRYAYENDNSGRTMTYYGADGEPTGEVESYVYDEHGNVIEQTTTVDGEISQKIVNTYVAMEVPVEES